MYGYVQYSNVPLTMEEILKRVSQEDIFKIVIKEDIIPDRGALYKAPYRDDDNADCYFVDYGGVLRFVDFGNLDNQRNSDNCFYFIKRCFKLDTLYDTLKFINNHFKLGLGSSTEEVKEVIYENDTKVEIIFLNDVRQERKILYTERAFDKRDKQFWQKYGISKDNLIEDGVIPITLYKSTNRKGEPFIVKPFDITYAYTGFGEGKAKIYRPLAPTKDAKWFTNCNQNDIGSIDTLPLSGDLLIISKSYKDCRVLRNENLNSIWLQNEGVMPSVEIIEMLCKRFTRIVVWFDNDQTGLAKGKAIKDYINSIYPSKCSTIFLPPRLLSEGIKDPSDLVATRGRAELKQFLEKNNLL